VFRLTIPAQGGRVKNEPQSTEAKESARAPVKIASVDHVDTGAQNWAFKNSRTFDQAELEEVSRISENEEYRKWFTTRDAVPAERRRDLITVEGNSAQSVEINGLQVDKKCSPPLSGTLFTNPNAGQANNISLLLDLDEQIPTPRGMKILVDASSTKYFCEYTLNLKITAGDAQFTQKVMDNGTPFKVSAMLEGKGDKILSGYQSAYVGGVLNTCGGGTFKKVDAPTWTSLAGDC
jgi:hypothetical protein